MIKPKLATTLNIVQIEDKFVQLTKTETLRYLKNKIKEEYQNFKTLDVKYIDSDSDSGIFKLVLLFQPIMH